MIHAPHSSPSFFGSYLAFLDSLFLLFFYFFCGSLYVLFYALVYARIEEEPEEFEELLRNLKREDQPRDTSSKHEEQLRESSLESELKIRKAICRQALTPFDHIDPMITNDPTQSLLSNETCMVFKMDLNA